MKKIDLASYRQIRSWVHRNARELELRIWQFHFEGGGVEPVLKALAFYQNEDGGIGNKIDPDNWNPASSPYNTEHAFRLLREIGFTDTGHPICQKTLDYLLKTEHRTDYGWLFTIPSNDGYPRAAWWEHSDERNEFQSIGVTAGLAGFILRYTQPDTELYRLSLGYTDVILEKLYRLDHFGDMGIKGYLKLLDDLEHAGLDNRFDLPAMAKKVKEIVYNAMRTDTKNFMAKPLEFIDSSGHPFYADNAEAVERELDLIIDSRNGEGVWGIPWEWYVGDKWQREFAITENWWKSGIATNNLLILKRFGRLEDDVLAAMG